MARCLFVWLHRWVGLLLAAFLVVIGLTGSLLAFNVELQRVFAPQLFATPRPGVAQLDLVTLMERAAPLIPHARVRGATQFESDQAAIAFQPETDPATGKPYRLGFTDFFIDPWTGAELGRRNNADLSEGLVNVMPFVFQLHSKLLIKGGGKLFLGILAIIWTLDCFVGFYLTLPVASSAFWRKWRVAWGIKRRAGAYRLNFDLHRAGGLWLWPMLLVFAWSGVMFNLRPAYDWAMGKLMDHGSVIDELKDIMHRPANPAPALGWRRALEVGERLMTEQAAQRGLTAEPPALFSYQERGGLYVYGARTSLHFPDGSHTKPALLMFDGDTGALIKFMSPAPERFGDLFDGWLPALHMAHVFGLPYKIFVSAFGLALAMLSATGVYIWWKKRKARRFRGSRARDAELGLETAMCECTAPHK
ncbi:PepSY domain-containing protein [Methylocystis sp.]|uniref:PepSY-associated TM helix domain-containing protein n=1 Tax=Methylocystis sp. TaxID=1911079 RepID=UPI0025F9A1CA|nr:PepSY-associated TM helix domain-containing protein [Methylocystis sp.]